MKVRDGFHMKHYELADGTLYRTEARKESGPWVTEVHLESRSTGSSGKRKARHTIEDKELVDATDGEEVCDLTWKRFRLAV